MALAKHGFAPKKKQQQPKVNELVKQEYGKNKEQHKAEKQREKWIGRRNLLISSSDSEAQSEPVL